MLWSAAVYGQQLMPDASEALCISSVSHDCKSYLLHRNHSLLQMSNAFIEGKYKHIKVYYGYNWK